MYIYCLGDEPERKNNRVVASSDIPEEKENKISLTADATDPAELNDQQSLDIQDICLSDTENVEVNVEEDSKTTISDALSSLSTIGEDTSLLQVLGGEKPDNDSDTSVEKPSSSPHQSADGDKASLSSSNQNDSAERTRSCTPKPTNEKLIGESETSILTFEKSSIIYEIPPGLSVLCSVTDKAKLCSLEHSDSEPDAAIHDGITSTHSLSSDVVKDKILHLDTRCNPASETTDDMMPSSDQPLTEETCPYPINISENRDSTHAEQHESIPDVSPSHCHDNKYPNCQDGIRLPALAEDNCSSSLGKGQGMHSADRDDCDDALVKSYHKPSKPHRSASSHGPSKSRKHSAKRTNDRIAAIEVPSLNVTPHKDIKTTSPPKRKLSPTLEDERRKSSAKHNSSTPKHKPRDHNHRKAEHFPSVASSKRSVSNSRLESDHSPSKISTSPIRPTPMSAQLADHAMAMSASKSSGESEGAVTLTTDEGDRGKYSDYMRLLAASHLQTPM